MSEFKDRTDHGQASGIAGSGTGRRASPRRRFWLACLGWLLPVPVIVLLLHDLLPSHAVIALVGLIGLWVATITWVLQAHRGSALAHRLILVTGLSLSLAICFSIGATALRAPVFNLPIDVTLPQRSHSSPLPDDTTAGNAAH